MYRNGILGCIVAIFFLASVMASSTGCSPAGLVGGAASLAVSTAAEQVTSTDESSNTGQGGKYALESYSTGETAWGGHYQRIDSIHFYVAYVSKGVSSPEGRWKEYIKKEMGISNYEVFREEIIETNVGFPARKLKSIIRVDVNEQERAGLP